MAAHGELSQPSFPWYKKSHLLTIQLSTISWWSVCLETPDCYRKYWWIYSTIGLHCRFCTRPPRDLRYHNVVLGCTSIRRGNSTSKHEKTRSEDERVLLYDLSHQMQAETTFGQEHLGTTMYKELLGPISCHRDELLISGSFFQHKNVERGL